MGITIHYGGKLKDRESLPALIEELEDIAQAMEWECTRFDEDWETQPRAEIVHTEHGAEIRGHLGLKGVVLSVHPDCEPFSFLFDRDGNLRDLVSMVGILQGFIDAERAQVNVKTQFAPLHVHITIIKLLKYIGKKYIANLEVNDEGDFWQTGDREILAQKLNFLNKKIDELAEALSAAEIENTNDLSEKDLLDKIERILKEKFEQDKKKGKD